MVNKTADVVRSYLAPDVRPVPDTNISGKKRFERI